MTSFGAAPPSFLVLDMLATHSSYKETHVSTASQPIKSFVYTSKKASFAAHMASSTVSLAALESRLSTSKYCEGHVKYPVLNPIQLGTHALGARHALPLDHALASPKDGDINTVVPVVLLSARRGCGRPVYTRALSDARTSSSPTPGFPSPDFTPTLSGSSSPIRNTKSTVLSAHSKTAMEFLRTHRFPTHRETLQLWQRCGPSSIITSCFCSLKPCVCGIVTSKILRHSSKESQRPSTPVQHSYDSPSSTVSSSPSLSPSISINTMTPTVETPSCAYTDIQTDTNYFNKHHGDHPEEENQQPGPAYMAEFPYVPCPCEPQPLNALGMSFVSLHPCTECLRRNPNSGSLPSS